MKKVNVFIALLMTLGLGVSCKKNVEKTPLLQEGLYSMHVDKAQWNSAGGSSFLKTDTTDFWGYVRVTEQDNGAIIVSFSDASIDNGNSTGHQFFAKKKEMHLLREGDVTGPTFDLEWSSENNAAAQGLLIIPTPSGGSWGGGLCYRFNTYKVFLKKIE